VSVELEIWDDATLHLYKRQQFLSAEKVSQLAQLGWEESLWKDNVVRLEHTPKDPAAYKNYCQWKCCKHGSQDSQRKLGWT